MINMIIMKMIQGIEILQYFHQVLLVCSTSSSVTELSSANFLSMARFSFLTSEAASTALTKLLILLALLMYCVVRP